MPINVASMRRSYDPVAQRLAAVKLDLLEMRVERFRRESIEREREYRRKAIAFARKRGVPRPSVPTWVKLTLWSMAGLVVFFLGKV